MDNLEDKFIQQRNIKHESLLIQNNETKHEESKPTTKVITYYTLIDSLGTACLNVNKFPSKDTAVQLQQVLNQITKNIEYIPEKELQKDLLKKVEKSLEMIVAGADPEGPLQSFVKMYEDKKRAELQQSIRLALKGSQSDLEIISEALQQDISYRKTAEITDDIIKQIIKMKYCINSSIFEVFSQIKIKNIKNIMPSSKHSYKQTREKLSKKMKKLKENLTDLEAHLVVYNQQSRENEVDAYQRCFCNSILELCLNVLKDKYVNLLLPALKLLQQFKPYLSILLIQDLSNLLKTYLRTYVLSFNHKCLDFIVKLTDQQEIQVFDVRDKPIFSLRRDIEALKQDQKGIDLNIKDDFYFRSCEFISTTEGIDTKICLIFMCLNIFKVNNDDKAKLLKKVLESQDEHEISFTRFCKELVSNIPGFLILDEWVKNQFIKLNINQQLESIFD